MAILVSSVFFLVTASNAYTSEDAGRSSSRDTVRDAVNEIVGYFEPVGGTIDTTDDGRLIVRLDKPGNIREGARLDVFKKGEPFRHPVTGEPVGFTEEHAGVVAVKDAIEAGRLFRASLVKGTAEKGDIARITSSRISLAFFQDKNADWSLSELFYEAIKKDGRFNILEKYTPAYEPDRLAALSRELGARVFLLLTTPLRDGSRFLDVKLYWADDARLLAGIEKAASEDTGPLLSPEEKFLVQPLTDREPWGSFGIAGGTFLASGDVDRDGKEEIVISDGSVLRIYSLGQDIQEKWRIGESGKLNHLSVDIQDINGNGIPEIFVTAINRGNGTDADIKESQAAKANISYRLRSYVIEYDGAGKYRKIAAEIPYFFRVSGNHLLMQGFNSRRGFSGPVFEAVWKSGRYLPGTPLNLPDGVNIYGFAEVDWRDEGRRYIVSFDDEGYISMFDDKGARLWRSAEKISRFEHEFSAGAHSFANPGKKWVVRNRIVTVRTARGQEAVLLRKVPVVEKVPGLGTKAAQVVALWWDGTSMAQNLILDEVSGTISDFRINGGRLYLVAKGSLFSFVKNAVSGDLGSGSVLYYYDFRSHPGAMKE